MKKFSRRALSLCMASLLVVGLLMVPASADEAEDPELRIGIVDPDAEGETREISDEELPSYLRDIADSTPELFHDIWAQDAEGETPQESPDEEIPDNLRNIVGMIPETIPCIVYPETKCIVVGGWTWDLSLLEEETKDMSWEERFLVEAATAGTIMGQVQTDAMEAQGTPEDLQEAEGVSAQAGGPCDNPSHPKKYPDPTYSYCDLSKSDITHSVTETYYEVCNVCFTGKLLRSLTTSEAHVFDSGRYISSNHSGPSDSHTYTYEYTCVCCKHVKRGTVPANCKFGCVDPQSVTPEFPES